MFLLVDKTVKLWKVSERRKRTDGFNLRDELGSPVDPSSVTSLRVPVFKPMELMVEASPRRVFANAHTYHINSISVNSDGATYLSADDLRINLWHMENNDQSFSILLSLLDCNYALSYIVWHYILLWDVCLVNCGVILVNSIGMCAICIGALCRSWDCKISLCILGLLMLGRIFCGNLSHRPGLLFST